MGYLIKFGDITEFESDAIVNSLGINGNVYGMICESVLKAADSQALTSYIDSLVNNKIGDIYVTEAGKLNCKNILHIVTPFKRMDDANYSLLKKAYNDLLEKAISLGHKSIVLPLIGSGANGYSAQEVSSVVTSVCGDLALKEVETGKDILDITIVSYVKPRRQRREREFEFYEYENTCCAPILNSYNNCKGAPTLSKKELEIQRNTLLIAKATSSIKEDEMLIVPGASSRPYSFVIAQLIEKDMDEKEFIKQGVPSDIKTRWSKRKELEKQNIYRIAFISKMNFTRLVQFMMINNKSFSPEDKLDMFVINYFFGKKYYKCYDLTGFSLLCHKECQVQLEFDRTKKNDYDE